VEVFGEFSAGSVEGAWNKRVLCQWCKKSKLYHVFVLIKLGQRFKFIIDEGKEYTTSKRYLQTEDGAGNMNNVFAYHARSHAENKRVLDRYNLIKVTKTTLKATTKTKVIESTKTSSIQSGFVSYVTLDSPSVVPEEEDASNVLINKKRKEIISELGELSPIKATKAALKSERLESSS